MFSILSRKRAIISTRVIFASANLQLTLYFTITTFNELVLETFWKHCWKRRKFWSHNVSYPSQDKISIFVSHLFCRLQILSVCFSLKLCCWINPFPNKPWFLRVCVTSLLKTLWETEKLHVTSNFSFCHIVFYPFLELSAIFIKFKIVFCKHFQFGAV